MYDIDSEAKLNTKINEAGHRSDPLDRSAAQLVVTDATQTHQDLEAESSPAIDDSSDKTISEDLNEEDSYYSKDQSSNSHSLDDDESIESDLELPALGCDSGLKISSALKRIQKIDQKDMMDEVVDAEMPMDDEKQAIECSPQMITARRQIV